MMNPVMRPVYPVMKAVNLELLCFLLVGVSNTFGTVGLSGLG